MLLVVVWSSCHCERSEAISFLGSDCFVAEPVLSEAQRSRRAPRNDILRPALLFSGELSYAGSAPLTKKHFSEE